jgi:hypothetical protein
MIKSTQDSIAKIKVIQSAKGSSFQNAKDRAERIVYNYELKGNTLYLDNHFIIPNDEANRDQEINITVYLPVGSVLFPDKNTHKFHTSRDLLAETKEGYYQKVENGRLLCIDCPDENATDDAFEIDVNINNDKAKIKINSEGFQAKTDENAIIIDENGVKGSTENVKVNIDENGVKITSEKEE